MLWSGESPKAESLKETMVSYFNALQGFFAMEALLVLALRSLLSYMSLLSKSLILASDCCRALSPYTDKKPSIPQLSRAVWEKCSSFKKVPATNIIAIGRAITQVAVSMKDVLREMKEVKPACPEASVDNNSEDDDDDDDLGDDLSPDEMEVAKIVAEIVSETIMVIKELIRVITGMIKMENPKDNSGFVDSLEKLCQGTGVQIDELGACVYPPQELTKMMQTVKDHTEKSR
ncbi:unnamed protein product [Cochlearia groenlandica]